MRMTLLALAWRLSSVGVLTREESALLAQLCKGAREYDGWRCHVTPAWLAHHNLRSAQEIADVTQSLEQKGLLLPSRRPARASRWTINVAQMRATVREGDE